MRFYSPGWVAAFNLAAAGSADPPDTAADAPVGQPGDNADDNTADNPGDNADDDTADNADDNTDGTPGRQGPPDFRLLQIVHDGPDGTLRIGLVSVAGHLVMTLDPPEVPAPQVTLSVAYDDAAALSRGETDPARLVATGRVKVRGELSVLLGGQAMLAEVAARVAALSAVTDY